MITSLLPRQTILQALVSALEPLQYTHAMWEGGAAAFDRVDEWSNIDLMIVVDDDTVSETFEIIESTLQALSPIDLRYEIPQPAWHGHAQVFYRLRDTSPYLLLDITVLRRSASNRFLEPQIHGHALVHFDKSSVVAGAPDLDPRELAERLHARRQSLRTTFDLFQVLILKELHRGNHIEALAFYHSYTLRPLVELLRMFHAPSRYNFHTRYVYYEFPPAVVSRLENLFFVRDASDLHYKHTAAAEWFHETLAALDAGDSVSKTVLEP